MLEIQNQLHHLFQNQLLNILYWTDSLAKIKKIKIFPSNFPMWQFSQFSALFPSLGETLRNICSLIKQTATTERIYFKNGAVGKTLLPIFLSIMLPIHFRNLKLLSTQLKKKDPTMELHHLILLHPELLKKQD